MRYNINNNNNRRATQSRTRSTTRAIRLSRTLQPQTCNIRWSRSSNNQQSDLTKCKKTAFIWRPNENNSNNNIWELRQKRQNGNCCRHQYNLILQLLFDKNCCFWSSKVSGYISFSSLVRNIFRSKNHISIHFLFRTHKLSSLYNIRGFNFYDATTKCQSVICIAFKGPIDTTTKCQIS